MTDRDYEAEATKDGWRPKEEFNGPEEKWVDAKQFVENGENINGILKNKLERVEAQVATLQTSNREFREYHEATLDKEKRRTQEAIADLEARRQQAVTDGDGQAFTETDRQINELRTPEPQQPTGIDPLAQQWVDTNQWYTTNQKLKRYADGLADEIRGQGIEGAAYFSELTRRVREDFPEEFSNTHRAQPSSVETGGAREGSDPKPHSYDSLPAEDKVMCDKFVRDIPDFTKEQFLSEYDWE